MAWSQATVVFGLTWLTTHFTAAAWAAGAAVPDDEPLGCGAPLPEASRTATTAPAATTATAPAISPARPRRRRGWLGPNPADGKPCGGRVTGGPWGTRAAWAGVAKGGAAGDGVNEDGVNEDGELTGPDG